MDKINLNENFNQGTIDRRLTWFNQPAGFSTGSNGLVITTSQPTDFWQKTHYGFSVDNGHFLYAEIEGDFSIETKVKSVFRHQYDQAGLMVRIDEACWIKTSIECEPGETNMLGVVVTNNGYSDWSTQAVSKDLNMIDLRITRKNSDYQVHWRPGANKDWEQLRMTHLFDKKILKAGIYCCSPKEAGFRAEFSWLKIQQS